MLAKHTRFGTNPNFLRNAFVVLLNIMLSMYVPSINGIWHIYAPNKIQIVKKKIHFIRMAFGNRPWNRWHRILLDITKDLQVLTWAIVVFISICIWILFNMQKVSILQSKLFIMEGYNVTYSNFIKSSNIDWPKFSIEISFTSFRLCKVVS